VKKGGPVRQYSEQLCRPPISQGIEGGGECLATALHIRTLERANYLPVAQRQCGDGSRAMNNDVSQMWER